MKRKFWFKFGRALIFIFRPVLWLIFPYKVTGREHIPTKEQNPHLILCSNHILAADPVYLLICQPRPIFFMAKIELFKTAVARWFIGSCFGAFPVARGEGDTSALDTSLEVVSRGEMLGIFPEGHRSRDGALLRFHSGAALIAAQTGADVLPVAIYAKTPKVKSFRRFYIAFGPVVTSAEMRLDNKERPDLRHATRLIRERIAALRPTGENGPPEKGKP